MSGFDEAYIRMPLGGYNKVAREEFLRMPINERVQMILNNRIQFVRDGQVISVSEALGTGKQAGVR